MYLFIFQVLLFLSWSAIITKSGPRRWSKDMSVCAIITIIIIIIKYWIIVNCVESSCFFLFLCPKISFLWLIVAIYYREKKVSYRVDILEHWNKQSYLELFEFYLQIDDCRCAMKKRLIIIKGVVCLFLLLFLLSESYT